MGYRLVLTLFRYLTSHFGTCVRDLATPVHAGPERGGKRCYPGSWRGSRAEREREARMEETLLHSSVNKVLFNLSNSIFTRESIYIYRHI